jgi:NitT/TauT family transport system permease protein
MTSPATRQVSPPPTEQHPPPTASRSLVRRRPEVVLSPLFLVGLVLVWDLATRAELISPILFPRPHRVAEQLREMLAADWFLEHVWATLSVAVVGFALALAVAVTLATLLHFSPLSRRVMYPFIILFQVTPAIVVAPLFIAWFGFGPTAKILVAFSIAFFVILVSTLAGFDAVDEDSRLLLRSLNASEWQTFRMLTVRTALPYLFAGIKTGVTLALIGAMVAEFISSRAGLGVLVTQFSFQLQQAHVFATIAVVAMLGLLLFALATIVERRVVWWVRPRKTDGND